MTEPTPAPFDDAELREKLTHILTRYGVDDRVVHAPLYQIAQAVAPYLK